MSVALGGVRIGRYEVLEEIARGGFGAVYRARDVDLSREVAIKVLLDNRDEEEVQRFLREGEAATRFRHPNVVRVYGLGRDGRRPYLVMDLVEGPSLAERLRREGPIPIHEAVALVHAVALGVEAAHQAGVLHRDLKPANVLLEAGRPLLTDFGIARLAGARTLTQTGELIGTPSFMAPEQVEGDRTRFGPPTDVYGLGAILYACLTGVPPFRGASIMSTMDLVVNTKPVSPREHRADVDSELSALCLKALAQVPEDRFASAAELAAALAVWTNRIPRGSSWRPSAVAVGSVLLVAFGSVAVVTAYGTSRRTLPTPDRAIPQQSLTTAVPYNDLELLKLGVQEKEACLVEAEATLRATPDSPEAHVEVARACLGTGDFKRADSMLKRAMELDPKYGPTYRIRGMVLSARRETQAKSGTRAFSFQALYLKTLLRNFDRALELNPRDWQALRQRAAVREEAGNFPGAKEDLDAWIAQAPSPAAYRARGAFLIARGQTAAGRSDLKKASEIAER